jgi:hypothetical protein
MSNDRAAQGQWVNVEALRRREQLQEQHEKFKAELQATIDAGPEHEGYEFANTRLREILEAEESVARHNANDTTGNHAIVKDELYQYPIRTQPARTLDRPSKAEEDTHAARIQGKGGGGIER